MVYVLMMLSGYMAAIYDIYFRMLEHWSDI